MNCRRVDLLLSDHLEGFLTPRLRRALTAHLDDCPRCRWRRDQLGAVAAELRRAEALFRPPALLDRAMESWLSERAAPRSTPRTASRERRAPSSIGRSPIRFSRRVHLRGWHAATVAAVLVAGAALVAGWLQAPFAGKETSDRHSNAPGAARAIGSPMAQALPPASRETAPRQTILPQRPERSRKRDEVPGAIVTTGRYPAELAPWVLPAPNPGRRRGGHADTHEADGKVTPPPADDLAGLNGDPLIADRRWRALPSDEWQQIEARVRAVVRVRDDFVTLPFPRLASTSNHQIAEAIASYKREAAIVDPRLSREVTCAFKATALSDLCAQLRTETGIELTAGSSVADEKVTVFCEKMPLRDMMRQLSRPFGYTWLRSKREGGEYRYELVQDLRSQLLEEELRNRDRDEALLALQREMDRYRPYLELAPDEALARSRTAAPAEKKLLEKLAGAGWGPIQMYFRLTPQELTLLCAGQALTFSQEPAPGEWPLPPGLARGVLECLRDVRVSPRDGAYDFGDSLALTAVPEARAGVTLSLNQSRDSELGRFTFDGSSRFATGRGSASGGRSKGPYAMGMSPAALEPENELANASLAHDPALQRRVTVLPGVGGEWSGAGGQHRGSFLTPGPSPLTPEAKRVTSADVLEALHAATGLPIVADFYTHLYQPAVVSVRNEPLFAALNHLVDAMRLRWRMGGRVSPTSDQRGRALGAPVGTWLQLRSVSFYDDRRKEVPNRLLARWAESRREHGHLTLADLIEIAGLSDAQLDANEMAEGAKEIWGVGEWDLARPRDARPHWRFLAQLTPAQRQEATSAAGLAITRLSLAQQQQFLATAVDPEADPAPSLHELSGATLQVTYTQPGGFEWPGIGPPVILSFRPSPVWEHTREAALTRARRLDPAIEPGQILPTELAVTILYRCSAGPGPYVRVLRISPSGATGYSGHALRS